MYLTYLSLLLGVTAAVVLWRDVNYWPGHISPEGWVYTFLFFVATIATLLG